MTFLFLGSMIEIIRDQVVYNSGSNLEVACIYRNSTGVSTSSNFGSSESFPKDDIQRRREEAVLRMIENYSSKVCLIQLFTCRRVLLAFKLLFSEINIQHHLGA